MSVRPIKESIVLAAILSGFLGFLVLGCDPEGPERDAGPPTNIAEAVNALDDLVSAESRKRVRDLDRSDLIREHFGVAGLVRNTWLYEEDSPLRDYFESEGIDHPDTMSAVVVQAYWMRLHELAIDEEKKLIDDRIAEIKAGGEPFTTPCPDDDGTLLELVFGLSSYDAEGQEVSRTLYSECPSTGSAWVFVVGEDGWRPATEAERKLISDEKGDSGPVQRKARK